MPDLGTFQIIKNYHQSNIKVYPWTVNSQKEMLSLANMGVDGIITDYPNLIKSLEN